MFEIAQIEPINIMPSFNLDYFLLVFVSAMGVYQVASIHSNLKGLWFFPWAKVQYAFGLLLIIGIFLWFFISENRNVQHVTEGSQQLYLFLSAIILSYVFTGILASIIQAKVRIKDGADVIGKQHDIGVETLKTTTLLGGILSSLKGSRKEKD